MEYNKKKIIRTTTVDISVDFFRDIMIKMREKNYEMIGLSSPGAMLTSLNKDDNFRIIEVPMERRISLKKDLHALWLLYRVFLREKPLVVHSITPKAGLLSMIAAWIARVPLRIHTFTGLVWPTETGIRRKVLMAADIITCFCATHIIPEGEGVKSDLQSNITSKPMKVLGYGNVMGVDMEKWNPSKFYIHNKEDNSFVFLFTGRIVGDKGINELIWAYTHLKKECPNIRLMLTGSYEKDTDPLLPETEKSIETDESIVVNGPYFGDELVNIYARADCFVMPSYREGFPNSVLEAGAMGLPQIVTDVNGSREIISNGINGLIVPSKDRDALYEAMKRIIIDAELRNSLKSNARKMIANRFERNFVQQCQIGFYEEILNE